MQQIFLATLALGAAALVIQIVAGLAAGVELEFGETAGAEDGLQLLSVRSIAAGAVLFGAAGFWLSKQPVPMLLAVPAAVAAGVFGAVATAYVTRQLLRLESDGTLRLDNAVGQAGTVYLPIPPRRAGVGKVQFTLQGRTVELRALSDEAAVLPTGSAVIVIGVVDDDTVEVTPTPQIEGM